jgi:hypothetical protein
MAYRRRLLRPLMSHSENFKALDVGVASIDRKLFDTVEAVVHREAITASRNPLNVVPGYLQQREVVRDGHTFRTFHGSPKTWMTQFMPGKAVTSSTSSRRPRLIGGSRLPRHRCRRQRLARYPRSQPLAVVCLGDPLLQVPPLRWRPGRET